jgi:hypothetical protein
MVSEKRFGSNLKVEIISTTLLRNTKRISEKLVLTRITRCHIPEDGILHSYRREEPQILHSINRLG